jgi:hypothetical protein
VAHAAAIDQHGVAVRLLARDFDDPSRLADELSVLLDRQLAVKPSEVDLVIDLKRLEPDRTEVQIVAVRSALQALPHIEEWRSLALAHSSFPERLARIGRDTTARLPRAEWTLWCALWEQRSTLPRLPSFADYAAESPSFFPGGYVDQAAAIRYTTDTAWLILRGHALSAPDGHEQFRQLARQLVADPAYRGPTFSAGDRDVDHCAQGFGGPGSPTTWRRIAVNHHLTLVVHELASLAWP